MRTRATSWILAGIVLSTSSLLAQPMPEIDPGLRAELRGHLLRHFRTPEAYVVSKFDDHDVVLLGEFHRIRGQVELVQRLVPLLYERGIRSLGTEFARRVDQPLVDSLVTEPEWDEELARTIVLRQFVAWGYREYVDVLKAAWTVNRARPPGAPPFRVLGLNNAPDWSHVKTTEDRDDPEVMRRVRGGETEEDWARVILDEVAAGRKVLVHLGAHHAFTRYHQPVVRDGEFQRFNTVRAGNHVHDELGDRAFLIYMHAVWPPREGYGGDYVRPADGYVDAFFRTLPPGLRVAGFDVVGSPFGDLPGETSVYARGYDDFTLATMVDGYLYFGPFCTYEGVTPIPDFIDEDNLDFARAQSVNPALRTTTAERYNAAVARSATLESWCEQLEPWPEE